MTQDSFGASDQSTQYRRPATEKEKKRNKVILELLNTVQTYVDGLELVYNHFLVPLIESLESPNPLLTEADLDLVFPGFIDTLNVNQSILDDLRAIFVPGVRLTRGTIPILDVNPSSSNLAGPILSNEAVPELLCAYTEPEFTRPILPKLATLLSTHAIELIRCKIYGAGSSASMQRLDDLSVKSNEAFMSWLIDKEKDPVCCTMRLRDWLGTIMQQHPKYLILVQDLIESTAEKEEGYSQLLKVLGWLRIITQTSSPSSTNHSDTGPLYSHQVIVAPDLCPTPSSPPAPITITAGKFHGSSSLGGIDADQAQSNGEQDMLRKRKRSLETERGADLAPSQRTRLHPPWQARPARQMFFAQYILNYKKASPRRGLSVSQAAKHCIAAFKALTSEQKEIYERGTLSSSMADSFGGHM